MKALLLTAPNEFSVEEVPDPSPGSNEVLCKVHRVGICGTDVHMIQGHYPGMWPSYFPFIPGHEWTGEVVALGDGAEDFGFAIGDRVAGSSHSPCSFCVNCVRGRYNLCVSYGNPRRHAHYGHTAQGSYADYVVHSIRSVFKLPDALDYDQAAIADPASIALHTANRGGVREGQSVVVIGAGPVGILAGDCALALGASRVIFAARGSRLDVVGKLGFESIDTNQGDPVAALKQLVPLGADVVLDAAGTPQSIPLALSMLARGGRCSTVGIPTEQVTLDLAALVLDELELVGTRAVTGEVQSVLDLMADGRVRASELITHRFPLQDFASGLDAMANRTNGAIKVLIDMSLG
ncbi:MAG: alcohol dehydrogenase catalytic domain-containing protein [Actinobacteria bacterium]|nr:alcohol dehydrogenase catalytic domain-containing protein [Actinomycetota bacterium]